MPQLIYTVQPGDSLSGIARLYGSTVQAIININNIVNPNLIYPGAVLLIPVEEESDPGGPPGSLLYTVQLGDTLYTISLLFGVSTQNILALNNIPSPYANIPRVKNSPAGKRCKPIPAYRTWRNKLYCFTGRYNLPHSIKIWHNSSIHT